MGDVSALVLPAFVPALVLAILLVPLARRLALAANLVAAVRPDRLHREVRPYGGGLAIGATLAILVAAYFLLGPRLPSVFGDRMSLEVLSPGDAGGFGVWPLAVRLGLGAILFFVIGLVDDRWPLRAAPKLGLQFLAAGIVVVGFGLKATAWLAFPAAPEIASILWIVVVVNAFNLFDHADGIAATVAVIAFGALAAGQILMGQTVVPAMALVAAGAVAGFLVYNLPPAQLFMGDAGSSLVGYLLAALMMAARYYFPDAATTSYVVLIPVAILAVPLFDMGCVLASRIGRRASPFTGDASSHLAHRMLARGWKPRSIVAFVMVVSIVTGAASICLYYVAGPMLVAAWSLVVAALLAVFIARRPPSPEKPKEPLPQPAAKPAFAVTPASLAQGLRRAVVVLGAAGILVLPQFSTNSSFIGVSGAPGPVIALTIGLAFWLMPVLLIASWAAESRVRLPRPWLLVPAGLFVAAVAVSVAAADDKASALVRGAELSGLWIGMAALAQALRTDGERRLLLAALVAAALVAAGLAVMQGSVGLQYTWDYFREHRLEVLAEHHIQPGSWMERAWVERFSGGVQASLGHPNVLAAFLLMGIFAACGLAREKWSEAATQAARVVAVGILLAAGFCAVALLLTDSRAGEAALVVGLYWLAVALAFRPYGPYGRRRLKIALYLAPLALAAVALAVAVNIDHPAVESALKTLRYRLDYWQATAEILRSHGLAGVGLENFGIHYIQFKAPQAPEEVADPHSMLLSMWSTLGLAGLAALVSLALVAIRAWLSRAPAVRPVGAADVGRAKTAAPDESLPGLLVPTMVLAGPVVIGCFFMGMPMGIVAVGVMAIGIPLLLVEKATRISVPGRPLGVAVTACIVGLVALALMEQIGTAVLEPPTAWAMLVLVVVSVGGGRLKAKAAPTGRTAGAEAVDQTGDTAGLRPSAKFALMVLALAMTFGYVRWVLVPVMRERALIMAAYQTDDLFERDEALRAAGEANPLAWEPAMFRGGSWQSAAASGRVPSPFIAFDRAAEAYTEALARQPRLRQAWLARADCLAPEGTTPDPAVIQQAVDNLENAARLYPTSVTTHLRLAKMLERLGDRRQALEEYRRTLELDDLLPPEFRRLDDPQRQAAEAAARQLEESLAAPPAGP